MIRSDERHCVHTNYTKECVVLSERAIRLSSIETIDGYVYWYEKISDDTNTKKLNGSFRVSLTEQQALATDRYDQHGVHFRMPNAPPFMGPVEYGGPVKGLSEEKRAKLDAITKEINDGIRSPKPKKPRIREPQAPPVQRRKAVA